MYLTKYKKNSYILMAVFILFALIIILLLSGAMYKSKYEEKIHPGIKINFQNKEDNCVSLVKVVENRTFNDVKETMKKRLNPRDNKVVFNHKGKEWENNLYDLGINYLVKESVGKVKDTWKSKNIFRIIGDLLGLIPFEEELSVMYSYEREKTKDELEKINKEIELKPENAKFKYNKRENELEIKSSREGKSINIAKNLDHLVDLVDNFKFFWEKDRVNLDLKIKDIEPEITENELKEKNIEVKMADYFTKFKEKDKGRYHNITLASKYFHGLLLGPGELISFNEILSFPREKGEFKKAPVLIDGELVPGEGGGLCQVSTTLYNAAIYAGLEIVERHNHGRPVDYINLGRDAAVAYDYLDLKLKNPYDYSVLIISYIDEYKDEMNTNKIKFKIFGKKEPEKNFRFKATDYKELTPPVEYITIDEKEDYFKEKKEKGKPGYEITTWRIIVDDKGREIDRDRLDDDYYIEIPTKYKVSEEKLEKLDKENR